MDDKSRFSDRVIGVGVGFVLIMIAAWVVGVPARDLAMWALVFSAAGAGYLAFLRRRSR